MPRACISSLTLAVFLTAFAVVASPSIPAAPPTFTNTPIPPLALSLLPSPTTETTDYALREPPAEEYVAAIPAMIEQYREEQAPVGTRLRHETLPWVIDAEVARRYSALYEVDSSLLFDADVALFPASSWVDRALWNQSAVMALLREHPVDLDAIDRLTFGYYEIGVTPRDFNADGANEWVFDVHDDAGWGYHQLMVVRRDEANRYQIVPTPLPWFSPGYGYWSMRGGTLASLRFEDINADGLPEWVLVMGGVGGNNLNHGNLFVLGWHDEALVAIAPHEPWSQGSLFFAEPAGGGPGDAIPRDVTWDFIDSDGDPALEIEQIQAFHDNWGCTHYQTRAFDWNAAIGNYIFAGEEIEFEDSATCALRRAQEAMWENDYDMAIPLYERSLRPSQDEDTLWIDVQLFARMRLALAYSLVGESERAWQLLNDTWNGGYRAETDLIGALVSAGTQAYLDDSNSLQLCVAMYDVFENANPWHSEPHWGGIMDRPVPFSSILFPAYDSTHAGCDAPMMVAQAISSHTFSTSESPLRELAEMGLEVARHITTDLDGDGTDEWLVWLDGLPVAPVLFTPSPGNPNYVVSRPEMFSYLMRDRVETAVRPLFPSGEMAVVELLSDTIHTDPPGYPDSAYFEAYRAVPPYGCLEGRGATGSVRSGDVWRGYLRLWRLEGNELHQILAMPFCEPRTMEALLPGGPGRGEVHGWAPIELNVDSMWVASAIYRWDEPVQAFIPQFTEEIDPQLVAEIEAREAPETTAPLGSVLFDALRESDPAEALRILDEALANDAPETDIDTVVAVHYWRGFLLETLGRPEEALREYQEIYIAAPESAWGMLAALHLEW